MTRVPDLPCAVCGKLMWRSSTALPEGKATCRDCRRSQRGVPKTYRHDCKCQSCRDVRSARMREYRVERAAAGNPLRPVRPTVPRTCEACGKSFDARVDAVNDGRGFYCSMRCSNLAKLNLPWDSVFDPSSRVRGHWIDLADRLAIYERDGWVCYLCGLPTNPDADSQGPDYLTLDHLIPWSTSDSPDNSPSNLKCAHRGCNSRKGVMSVEEYRSRFGSRKAAGSSLGITKGCSCESACSFG